MGDFVPAFVIAILVVIFIISYVLNKRTKVPESALQAFDEASCAACNNYTCSHHGGAN